MKKMYKKYLKYILSYYISYSSYNLLIQIVKLFQFQSNYKDFALLYIY